MASDSELVTDAREHVGESLRVVATYDEHDVEFRYLRDDVAEAYTADDIDAIREHVLLEGLQEPHLESLFNDRDLRCQMLAFEDALGFHFNSDTTSGHFVAVDSTGLDDLNAFITDCTAHATGEN